MQNDVLGCTSVGVHVQNYVLGCTSVGVHVQNYVLWDVPLLEFMYKIMYFRMYLCWSSCTLYLLA